jgi:hypothetical protein
LAKYPRLKETPLGHPAQRTEWNVRDSDATLIITDGKGLPGSIGSQRAYEWAHQHGKPILVVNHSEPEVVERTTVWVLAQAKRFGAPMTLGIGGPRESEAPGIYAQARMLIAALLDRMS